jgi:hypothetical protein
LVAPLRLVQDQNLKLYQFPGIVVLDFTQYLQGDNFRLSLGNSKLYMSCQRPSSPRDGADFVRLCNFAFIARVIPSTGLGGILSQNDLPERWISSLSWESKKIQHLGQ